MSPLFRHTRSSRVGSETDATDLQHPSSSGIAGATAARGVQTAIALEHRAAGLRPASHAKANVSRGVDGLAVPHDGRRRPTARAHAAGHALARGRARDSLRADRERAPAVPAGGDRPAARPAPGRAAARRPDVAPPSAERQRGTATTVLVRTTARREPCRTGKYFRRDWREIRVSPITGIWSTCEATR